MELKLLRGFLKGAISLRSNRTFMELKSVKWDDSLCGFKCSNRTFMELK